MEAAATFASASGQSRVRLPIIIIGNWIKKLTIPFVWFCTGVIEKDPDEQCQQ
jgi:hypothetical protein